MTTIAYSKEWTSCTHQNPSTWLAELWRPSFLSFFRMIEQKPCPLKPTRGLGYREKPKVLSQANAATVSIISSKRDWKHCFFNSVGSKLLVCNKFWRSHGESASCGLRRTDQKIPCSFLQIFSTLSCDTFSNKFRPLRSWESLAAALVVKLQTKMIQELQLCQQTRSNNKLLLL